MLSEPPAGGFRRGAGCEGPAAARATPGCSACSSCSRSGGTCRRRSGPDSPGTSCCRWRSTRASSPCSSRPWPRSSGARRRWERSRAGSSPWGRRSASGAQGRRARSTASPAAPHTAARAVSSRRSSRLRRGSRRIAAPGSSIARWVRSSRPVRAWSSGSHQPAVNETAAGVGLHQPEGQRQPRFAFAQRGRIVRLRPVGQQEGRQAGVDLGAGGRLGGGLPQGCQGSGRHPAPARLPQRLPSQIRHPRPGQRAVGHAQHHRRAASLLGAQLRTQLAAGDPREGAFAAGLRGRLGARPGAHRDQGQRQQGQRQRPAVGPRGTQRTAHRWRAAQARASATRNASAAPWIWRPKSNSSWTRTPRAPARQPPATQRASAGQVVTRRTATAISARTPRTNRAAWETQDRGQLQVVVVGLGE